MYVCESDRKTSEKKTYNFIRDVGRVAAINVHTFTTRRSIKYRKQIWKKKRILIQALHKDTHIHIILALLTYTCKQMLVEQEIVTRLRIKKKRT